MGLNALRTGTGEDPKGKKLTAEKGEQVRPPGCFSTGWGRRKGWTMHGDWKRGRAWRNVNL